MTPKENAIYLIHLFNRGGYGKINARIHVEEILSINSVDKDEDLSNYWEQVKQEIEKTMNNNKQQTALEWFIEELEEKGKAYEENQVVRTINICIDVSDYMELKVQAKEMEKQQIINAFWNGDNTDCTSEQNIEEFADQYYNETYGGGEQ
jgi:hypothetical protein